MADIEKTAMTSGYKAGPSPPASEVPPAYGENEYLPRTRVQRIIDSFKRDPNAHVEPPSTAGSDERFFDVDAAARATAESSLHRKLKGRHLQMIAIGGSIGTGLFVGSGTALNAGGPASLFLAFLLTGIMLYCTVQALGEMAVLYPVSGSFSAYSTRFLDPAWGFAMGWNYAMQWLVVLPLEIVAATLVIDFWSEYRISNNAWVALFLVLIVGINLFGVKGYGEAEFIFSIIKVIAVVGFILLGIILNCGGGPDGSYIGGKYWQPPYEPFVNGFKGLCSVFVTAAFAFAGTELVGLAAAETANPRKSLPTAIKQVFWRITIFYLVSLILVGLLVPADDERLLGNSSVDASASPFVIAIVNAGIEGLPSVMNAVILCAVLSVGTSSVFGSSRTLVALAEQRCGPRWLAYIDRKGRPLYALLVAASFGFLAFFAGSQWQTDAFSWMLALSGLSSIFTWGSICLAHIRFRRAWHAQGHTLDELAFRSQPGIIGSWIGFIMNVLVLCAQFWTGAWPVGYPDLGPAGQAKSFFNAYLATPVVLIFYILFKVIYKTPLMRSHNMDLHTGMRDLNIADLIAQERAERATWPKWKKFYKFFC